MWAKDRLLEKEEGASLTAVVVEMWGTRKGTPMVVEEVVVQGANMEIHRLEVVVEVATV